MRTGDILLGGVAAGSLGIALWWIMQHRKRDTRFASRSEYIETVYGLFRVHVPHVPACLFTANGIKAQRGWKPNGKLWNWNLFGVKANKSYREHGGSYFVAHGSEWYDFDHDGKVDPGEYQGTTMYWRSYPSAEGAVTDYLHRMHSHRYQTAYAFAISSQDLELKTCLEWAGLMRAGGYFTAPAEKWGKNIYDIIHRLILPVVGDEGG